MGENNVFDLSGLDSSLELNLSLDPAFDLNDSADIIQHPGTESEEDNRFKLVKKAVQHYLKYNLTLSCLEATLKLMNEGQNNQKKLPETKYLIFKTIADRSPFNFGRKYYVKCSKCNIFSRGSCDKQKQECEKCRKTLIPGETNFFVYMPVEHQLIQSLTLNWDSIQTFNTIQETDSISDVHSATALKSINRSFENTDQNILSLTLNTDGANKFKSNSVSVWPIQLIQNYLPPDIRFQPLHILTVGLYYGDHKPNCLEYFEPLVSEFKMLKDRGLNVTIGKEEYVFCPLITHIVVDLPAKRMVQCIRQFNGYHSCTYCLHPGTRIEISKKTKVVRYTNEEFSLRSEVATLRAMSKRNFKPDNDDGVMGLSCLVSLPKFQIIKGFGVDYMHCVCIGVVRNFLNFFMNPKHYKRAFYLNKTKLSVLEKKFLSIKPISEIERKPKPFANRCDYTANEQRSILLYYFPVCLIGVLPSKYLNNFQLLSFAIYILLKPSISNDDLTKAEKYLKDFVYGFEILYGKSAMVMNIHLLTHIVESVRHLGPLWTQSAFPFERNNGTLLKSITGTTNILDQMSSKYLLRKYLQKPLKLNVDHFIKFSGRSITLRNMSLTLYEDGSDKYISIMNQTLTVYRGIQINGVKYTSRIKKELKKSVDYFIGLKSGTLGIAKFYVAHENKKYVFLDEYETIETIGHILDVEPTTVHIFAPVEFIDKKFIYMKLNNKEYITCMPNNFENE